MWKSSSIFNAYDEMFEHVNQNSSTYSKTDIRQDEKGYTIDVLLPGFSKEEVTVRTEGKDVILEAATERKLPKFLNSKMKKTFQVENLDCESVSAKLENGVLSIVFSTEAKKNSRSISIL
jgi:HSP20 family protein